MKAYKAVEIPQEEIIKELKEKLEKLEERVDLLEIRYDRLYVDTTAVF